MPIVIHLLCSYNQAHCKYFDDDNDDADLLCSCRSTLRVVAGRFLGGQRWVARSAVESGCWAATSPPLPWGPSTGRSAWNERLTGDEERASVVDEVSPPRDLDGRPICIAVHTHTLPSVSQQVKIYL